jgi:hypothetical protein
MCVSMTWQAIWYLLGLLPKASKAGRCPPTPSTDYHPLAVGATTSTTSTASGTVQRHNTRGGGSGGGGGDGGGGGGGGGAENAHHLGDLCARYVGALGLGLRVRGLGSRVGVLPLVHLSPQPEPGAIFATESTQYTHRKCLG